MKITNEQSNLLKAISELNCDKQFESIVENWETTGLLEGLNEDEKHVIAWNLEQIAEYLLSENCPLKNNVVDIVAFPAARRILKKDISQKLNIPDFLSELQFDYAKARVEFNENNEKDMEAEFLSNWCYKYSDRINPKKIALNEEVKRWKFLAGIK